MARFGGALMAFSLVLPFYALSFAGFQAMSFRLWSLDKGAFVLIAAFALFALAQVKLADRETTAMIYMIMGAIFVGALVYKLWISPPGSAPIGDLGGGQSMTINGEKTSLSGISTRDVLEAMGIHPKATYGAYVASLGAGFVALAAFLEWRSSADAPEPQAYDPQRQFAQQGFDGVDAGNFQPAQPSYAQPVHQQTPPVAAPAAPAPNVPADPFAPPVAAPGPAPGVPADPFAPPVAAQVPAAAPPPPPVPPGPPARPPGS